MLWIWFEGILFSIGLILYSICYSIALHVIFWVNYRNVVVIDACQLCGSFVKQWFGAVALVSALLNCSCGVHELLRIVVDHHTHMVWHRCRKAKREVRLLERAARRLDSANFAASAAATDARPRIVKCRAYLVVLNRKREAFWQFKIDSERSSRHHLELWRFVYVLMGRA